MIAVWRRCIGCGCEFGLTRRQSHPGLVAGRRRCGPCRIERRRQMTAARNRRWRQTHRDAEWALSRPSTGSEGA